MYVVMCISHGDINVYTCVCVNGDLITLMSGILI